MFLFLLLDCDFVLSAYNQWRLLVVARGSQLILLLLLLLFLFFFIYCFNKYVCFILCHLNNTYLATSNKYLFVKNVVEHGSQKNIT